MPRLGYNLGAGYELSALTGTSPATKAVTSTEDTASVRLLATARRAGVVYAEVALATEVMEPKSMVKEAPLAVHVAIAI